MGIEQLVESRHSIKGGKLWGIVMNLPKKEAPKTKSKPPKTTTKTPTKSG